MAMSLLRVRHSYSPPHPILGPRLLILAPINFFVYTGTSIWTVGYVIGQIPSNLLLTRVSPRWVIPSLEIGWGIATICTSSVTSYRSLYALRFLVGLFEYAIPVSAHPSTCLVSRSIRDIYDYAYLLPLT